METAQLFESGDAGKGLSSWHGTLPDGPELGQELRTGKVKAVVGDAGGEPRAYEKAVGAEGAPSSRAVEQLDKGVDGVDLVVEVRVESVCLLLQQHPGQSANGRTRIGRGGAV